MQARAALLMTLVAALCGCHLRLPIGSVVDTTGPNTKVSFAPELAAHGEGGLLPTQASTGPGTAGSSSLVIHGHVYMSPHKGAYRLASLTRTPVAGAHIEVRRFEQTGITEVSAHATSDASGAYSVGSSDTNAALYVAATIPVADGYTTLLAPVPMHAAPDVTVDLDVESTMITQALLDKTAVPAAAHLDAVLTPDELAKVRARLDTLVTDDTAPDASVPAQLFDSFQTLAKSDTTVGSLVTLVPPPSPPPPLPSPTTIVPAVPVPGPSMDDPPLVMGPDGLSNQSPPQATVFLAPDFTKIKQGGQMAVCRVTKPNDVLMAALDASDGSVFTFYRDEGSPVRLTADAIGAGTPRGLAVDKGDDLYVLGADKLVRLTLDAKLNVTQSGVLPGASKLQGVRAIAVDAAGTMAVVATADGVVHKLSLPDGALHPDYGGAVGGDVVALSVAADGSVYAGSSDGKIALVSPDGATVKPYGTVTGLDALSINPSGELYVGTTTKQVYKVLAGEDSPHSLFISPAGGAFTGVACLGNYLFMLEDDGNMDTTSVSD